MMSRWGYCITDHISEVRMWGLHRSLGSEIVPGCSHPHEASRGMSRYGPCCQVLTIYLVIQWQHSPHLKGLGTTIDAIKNQF